MKARGISQEFRVNLCGAFLHHLSHDCVLVCLVPTPVMIIGLFCFDSNLIHVLGFLLGWFVLDPCGPRLRLHPLRHTSLESLRLKAPSSVSSGPS